MDRPRPPAEARVPGTLWADGITASLLEPFRTPPGSPVGGIMVCYFVLTSWVAARPDHATQMAAIANAVSTMVRASAI